MNLQLEVFFVTIDKDEVIYLRKTLELSKRSENPDSYVDSIVKKEANKLKIDRNKCIIHSTSWHYIHKGLVVLTYIVYSDFMRLNDKNADTIKLENLSISQGSALKPSPSDLKEENIIAHALRHISLLLKHEPFTYEKSLSQTSIELFKKFSPVLSGQIFNKKQS